MSTADESYERQADHVTDNFSARDAMLDWMQAIAPYGIFTTDAELRIRTWNAWLATHSGLAAEQVVGRFVGEVFPELATRKLDPHFHRALAGEVSVLSTALHKYLLRFPSPTRDTGSPHMLQTVRIAPLPAGDLIIGTITIIEDVTQRERQAMQLQRQQEHDRITSAALGALLRTTDPLRDISELFPQLTLPLGLEVYFNFLFDPASHLLRLNAAGGIAPRHREMVATLKPDEGLCGTCAAERRMLVLADVQNTADESARFIRALGLRAYCCFPLTVGERFLGTLSFGSYTRDSIAPDEIECLSKIAQYVAVAMDRSLRESALHDAQHSLREYADALETKVAERTARLHETIAQLESFSYTVAHDLRAPIRALKGYSDILRTEFTLSEGGDAILARLQRASNRLDALTRDLLKFSRISRQDVQLEPVDVAEVVQDILLISPALQDGVLTVQEPLGAVLAQRTLLQQCLSNLFENALKFAAPDRPPRVTIRSEHLTVSSATLSAHPNLPPDTVHPATPSGAPTPRIRLWVEDNGIGIAPESQRKIFGIFERVSGLDHIEGTGIGLAIVARAMEQMSGSCGVESAPGAGSRFWLEFAPAAL